MSSTTNAVSAWENTPVTPPASSKNMTTSASAAATGTPNSLLANVPSGISRVGEAGGTSKPNGKTSATPQSPPSPASPHLRRPILTSPPWWDLLKDNGLVDTLSGKGDLAPFTVFAPTNDAFGDLLDTVDIKTVDVAAVLKYHVIAESALTAAELKDNEPLATLNGASISVDTTAGVKLNDITNDAAKVIGADNAASNGVVHAIDKVLIPPDYLKSGSSTSVEIGK